MNKNFLRRPLPFLLFLSFSTPALAIYKCETGDKITYSDVPCPSGKVVNLVLKANGSVPAADAAEARQQAANEKSEVTQMENARHKREAIEDREQRRAARSAAIKKKHCAGLALREKWSEEDAAAAAGKSSEKAKRKARRAAEKYEMECKAA